MNFHDSSTDVKKKVVQVTKPTKEEAEDAVRTLLRWAGDDPTREGLIDTPQRVVKAYGEWFAGYSVDPETLLRKTFEDVNGYSEMVTLKDVRFESYCEHHLAPIIGKAHVSYIPNGKVLGISKIARLVDVFAKRLQVQEKMTIQISSTMQNELEPLGVAVLIEGEHHCMCTRGVHKTNSVMTTSSFTGVFKTDRQVRKEFFKMLRKKS